MLQGAGGAPSRRLARPSGRLRVPGGRCAAVLLLAVMWVGGAVAAAADCDPSEQAETRSVSSDPPLSWRALFGGAWTAYLVVFVVAFAALLVASTFRAYSNWRKTRRFGLKPVLHTINALACFVRLGLLVDPLGFECLYPISTQRFLRELSRILWFLMLALFIITWRRIVMLSRNLRMMVGVVHKDDRPLVIAAALGLLAPLIFSVLEALGVEPNTSDLLKRVCFGIDSFVIMVFGTYYAYKLDQLLASQRDIPSRRTRRKVRAVVSFLALVALLWASVFAWALLSEEVGPAAYLAYIYLLTTAEWCLALGGFFVLLARPGKLNAAAKRMSLAVGSKVSFASRRAKSLAFGEESSASGRQPTDDAATAQIVHGGVDVRNPLTEIDAAVAAATAGNSGGEDSRRARVIRSISAPRLSRALGPGELPPSSGEHTARSAQGAAGNNGHSVAK